MQCHQYPFSYEHRACTGWLTLCVNLAIAESITDSNVLNERSVLHVEGIIQQILFASPTAG